MHRINRYRPSPALVVASIALLVALGGTGFAAVTLAAPNSVGTRAVINGSLLKQDFKAGQSPPGRPELRAAHSPTRRQQGRDARPGGLQERLRDRNQGLDPAEPGTYCLDLTAKQAPKNAVATMGEVGIPGSSAVGAIGVQLARADSFCAADADAVVTTKIENGCSSPGPSTSSSTETRGDHTMTNRPSPDPRDGRGGGRAGCGRRSLRPGRRRDSRGAEGVLDPHGIDCGEPAEGAAADDRLHAARLPVRPLVRAGLHHEVHCRPHHRQERERGRGEDDPEPAREDRTGQGTARHDGLRARGADGPGRRGDLRVLPPGRWTDRRRLRLLAGRRLYGAAHAGRRARSAGGRSPLPI